MVVLPKLAMTIVVDLSRVVMPVVPMTIETNSLRSKLRNAKTKAAVVLPKLAMTIVVDLSRVVMSVARVMTVRRNLPGRLVEHSAAHLEAHSVEAVRLFRLLLVGSARRDLVSAVNQS